MAGCLANLLLLGASALFALGLAEGAVRLAGIRIADDPFLEFGRVESFFERINVGGRPHLRFKLIEDDRERDVTFPAVKAPGTFRVFCLGSSAGAGWPHPASESYSAYLANALRRAFPDRTIEVLNVSVLAYAAYRVRLIFQQIIDLEPDLVVVYTGNNEFLEKRSYGERDSWHASLARLADRLVLYRLARGSRVGRRLFPENTFSSENREHIAYEVWSKIQRLSLWLRKDPEQFSMVQQHYAFSIRSMAAEARARAVPVILVTVPVNLRDWRPNVSEQPLSGADLVRWQDAYRQGRTALVRGEAAAAVEFLANATRLNPENADSTFFLARALEAAGRFAEAHSAYSRARDLDFNPFRALSSFADIVREIAAGSDHVLCADAEKAFQSASAPRAPGFDLFLDYVHPTKRGNLILAKLVFDLLVERRILGTPAATTDFQPLPSAGAGATAEYADGADYELQSIVITLSMLMHQHEHAYDLVRPFLDQPENLGRLNPARAQFVRSVAEVLPRLIAAERAEDDGSPPPPEERARLDRQLHESYERFWGLYETFKEEAGN